MTPSGLSSSSSGHQTDLRHIHQPCHLAQPRSRAAEEPRPTGTGPQLELLLRARRGPACHGAHGRGLVLTTAEPPAIAAGQPGQARRATRGGWRAGLLRATGEPASWTVAARPEAQGLRSWGPALFFLRCLICPVGDFSVCLCPHLCILWYRHCSLCASLSPGFSAASLPSLSAPHLLCPAPLASLSVPSRHFLCIFFLSLSFSSSPPPCHPFLIHKIFHVQKRKKKEKKIKTQKS